MNEKLDDEYQEDIDCGWLYVGGEVATQMLRAINYSLNHNQFMSGLDKMRLKVAAQIIVRVFGDTQEDRDSEMWTKDYKN